MPGSENSRHSDRVGSWIRKYHAALLRKCTEQCHERLIDTVGSAMHTWRRDWLFRRSPASCESLDAVIDPTRIPAPRKMTRNDLVYHRITIARALRYMLTGPSEAPALIDPFIYPTLNTKYADGSDKYSPTKLRLALWSCLADDQAAVFLKNSLDQVTREGNILDKPDHIQQKTMAATALAMIPDTPGPEHYPIISFWCLRALCRQSAAPSEMNKAAKNLLALRGSVMWPTVRYVLCFLLNQRDMCDTDEIITALEPDGGMDPLYANELFRRHTHTGNLRSADAMVHELERIVANDNLQRFAYQIRLGHLRLEQGQTQEAQDLFISLRSRLPELARSFIDNPRVYEYWATASNLLWAMMEVYSDEPHSSTTNTILSGLRTSVQQDLPDLAMIAIMLLGEILQRNKQFQEAIQLWHYLFDAAWFLDHATMMTKACIGLSECTLWLKTPDTLILHYIEEVITRVKNSPGRLSELLLARAWHHLLRKRLAEAKSDMKKAGTIIDEQGAGLHGAKALGVDVLLHAATKKVWSCALAEVVSRMLLRNTPLKQFEAAAEGIRGQRGFFKWKHEDAKLLLQKYRGLYSPSHEKHTTHKSTAIAKQTPSA